MSAKRKIVLICGLVVVVASAVVILPRASTPENSGPGARRQAMELLGARIAKLCPNCEVLVLSNPFAKDCGFFDEKAQYERAGLRGLRKGLGGRSSVEVVFPEIRSDYFTDPQSVMMPHDSRTPLSFLMRAESVQQLAEAHPQSRVIVSLIGLPAEVERLSLWKTEDPRCFALLLPDLRLLGPPKKTVEAFQRGKLLAAVVEDVRSGAPFVVTRENVEDVLQQQPGALGF